MVDRRFEKLKTCLFNQGYEAICDFLDYEYPEGEDKDVTDKRLDEVYEQMPENVLNIYYTHYEI